MELFNTLCRLSELYGASGSEEEAVSSVAELMKELDLGCNIDNRSTSLIAKFGEFQDGLPLIALDAHIDQVGMIVTYITDEGFIKFSNLGGLDRRLLPAQQVIIHGKRKIKGVICSVPPHLSSGDNGVLKYEDAAIDTGMTKAELEEIVSYGDTITFDVKCRKLLGNRMTGCALDDRCGVASILHALELLKGKKLRYNVAVVFSAQEELGERGAKICAYELNPDIALAVDVSFGMAVGENPKNCGELGKGAMIGISPSLSREISNGLINTAKAENIPYQIEVMNDLTSTNADQYSVTRCGVKACTISVPLRNMHTPVEVIDIEDIRLTSQLIASFIKEDK